MKPKVYMETSILSYLTAHPSNDIRVIANQNITIDRPLRNENSAREAYSMLC